MKSGTRRQAWFWGFRDLGIGSNLLGEPAALVAQQLLRDVEVNEQASVTVILVVLVDLTRKVVKPAVYPPAEQKTYAAVPSTIRRRGVASG